MDEQNQAPRLPQTQQTNDPPQQIEPAPMVPDELEPATTGTPPLASTAPYPVALGAFDQNQPQAQSAPAKRKKWPIVAAVAAAMVVLLGAGAALAYTFWYQNPQRVIMDGIANAIQAKTISYAGTMNLADLDDKKTSVKLDLKGAADGSNADLDVVATIIQDDRQYRLSGKGVFDAEGVLYVRFQDIGKMIDDVLKSNPEAGLPEGTAPLIDKLVAKLDNRWVKIRPSDLKELSGEGADALTCMKETSDMLRNDKNAKKELATLYQKNPFIRVDENLGTKNGSIGYVISPDEVKQKAFWTDMKNTALYKKLQSCGNDLEVDQEDLNSDEINSQRTEIWVSQWQHEITQLKVTAEDKDGANVELVWLPIFNKEVKIDVPGDAATLSELQADIQNIMMEYMMGQMSAESSLAPGLEL